jgi:hypothetical protein
MKFLYTQIFLWLCSPCGPWPLFHFLNPYTVGRISWTVDQPVVRSLPTHRTTQTYNKWTPTFTPLVGFEPTIPVFEQEKTVHALDRADAVIGCTRKYYLISSYVRGSTLRLHGKDQPVRSLWEEPHCLL